MTSTTDTIKVHPVEKPLFRPEEENEEPCTCCKCWMAKRLGNTLH